MSLVPFAPFDDMMANEHPSVSRVTDREKLPLLLDKARQFEFDENWELMVDC
jgi:hypothetical protein